MNSTLSLHNAFHPETWETVSLNLLTKMISEFMYEEIITPEKIETNDEADSYQLALQNGVAYTFRAKKRLFDSYRVFPETIRRHQDGSSAKAVNPIQFLLDLRSTIGMTSMTAGHLIREYNQTLIADAHILEKKHNRDVDLTELDYAELEGEMEGHPWITYNKGRIGFGYDDYLAYAPEQKKPVQFAWVAVHKERAEFHAVPNINHDELVRGELGDETYLRFKQTLSGQGLNAGDYYLLPVHEWQWNNYIVPFFAEELARKYIIPLGKGEDWYLPQQSIRTFVNTSHKNKHHVKLPMSILNTLVYRGLPGERTVLAPKITEYIKGIWEKDTFLRDECRMILPGEIASLNVDHPYYEKLEGAPYQYLEMLGCIWRESIYSCLDEGEKPITLASLLHIDGNGKPFVSALAEKSGLDLEEWLNHLFDVVLPPLLHYLYRYGVVFSPHGQNTILVLKDFVPHRLAMKDFVDDVNVSKHPLPELAGLPGDLKKVLRSEPPEGLCQFIFTGLFICHMRYLSNLLEIHHQYPEPAFWQKVRTSILQYQERFPELKERYQLFDLLKPRFTKLCLNRNRMLDYGYSDDDDRPHASEYGQVNNALAAVSLKQV
ncbi:IucA/IucC family protein [Paenactinomyces guangxiensis]|uniref:IucA/IucC family siderophore biosynthesis protein n=1 Tax=Paenactinomyces guangxiensis TaxID=1490290 RepID=A0A7W2AAE3_9BACL|nr:IucA/IucC family siderophore biosynthesis protein [Paenactinomyces guangxiensis]MBA4496114.1 IucA/IucC family siderophore biosynthesis protein [Paenactinomyces guangxiensis]MBH8593202.1 IucA/IucC family siderophore biosynthesis protein [Paenactinomyces guangxiensis]